MRKTALLLGLLLLLGSGCLSDAGRKAQQPAVPEPPTVVRGDGIVTLSAPMAAIGTQALNFSVASNVTLVLAEITWEDPMQDIDLALASPSAGMTGTAQNYDHVARAGSPGDPDSPHSLTVETPEAGDWKASAFGNGAAAMVDYRLAITLFHGETTVPDGYTALG